MLGLKPDAVPPSYGLLVDLAHPEDRRGLPSPAQVVQGDVGGDRAFRVTLSDGTVRRLAGRIEVTHAGDGRPRAAGGVILDVTDGGQLVGIQAADQRRRSALYLQTRTILFSVRRDLSFDFPPEVQTISGRTIEEINAFPFDAIVPDERAYYVEKSLEHRETGRPFQGTPLIRIATGEVERFRVLVAPIQDATGRFVEAHGVQHLLGRPAAPIPAGLQRGLEQAVRGHHLRAARGLLDWSMSVLAEASGLSLSTVRRLEEDAEHQGARSRHKAVAALRQAGIRFIVLDDGSLALARI
ncbi:MAG: histidine kinase [Methylobacterium frigidaeris]